MPSTTTLPIALYKNKDIKVRPTINKQTQYFETLNNKDIKKQKLWLATVDFVSNPKRPLERIQKSYEDEVTISKMQTIIDAFPRNPTDEDRSTLNKLRCIFCSAGFNIAKIKKIPISSITELYKMHSKEELAEIYDSIKSITEVSPSLNHEYVLENLQPINAFNLRYINGDFTKKRSHDQI